MTGEAAPATCTSIAMYSTNIAFPCASTNGPLVIESNDFCGVNMSYPTTLTCHNPLEQRIVLSEE